MPTTTHYIKNEKAWQKKYDASAPKAGDLAPDFELADVRGNNLVRLSDFQGRKPVALVFGSFT
jgi:peroxiredoxin